MHSIILIILIKVTHCISGNVSKSESEPESESCIMEKLKCNQMIDEFVDEIYSKNQICTVVIGADFQSHQLFGYNIICGPHNNISEFGVANIARESETSNLPPILRQSFDRPSYHNSDIWIFKNEIIDSKDKNGAIVIISAHTGLIVFSGQLTHEKNGNIMYPLWRDPDELNVMCSNVTDTYSNPHVFNTIINQEDDDFIDVNKLLKKIYSNALITALNRGGHIFDITVVLYSGSFQKFSGESTKLIIIINAGLERDVMNTNTNVNTNILISNAPEDNRNIIKQYQICTAVIRADYLSYRLKGFSFVCGLSGLSKSSLNNMSDKDAHKQIVDLESKPLHYYNIIHVANQTIFYRSPSDFGTAIIVSQYSEMPVFGGSIVRDGSGSVFYPKEWTPIEKLNASKKNISVPLWHGYDILKGKTFNSSSESSESSGLCGLLRTIFSTNIVDSFEYIDETNVLIYQPERSFRHKGSTQHKEWIILLTGNKILESRDNQYIWFGVIKYMILNFIYDIFFTAISYLIK